MLAAAELPRHLHVGRPIELVVFDVAAVGERPLAAGLEVVVPRQRGAERLHARAEQIELVAQRGVGAIDDRADLIRVARRETPARSARDRPD